MPDERRYAEEEIAEIFETAAQQGSARSLPSPAQGMTLAELQAIGGEVGLDPESIAQAAGALELRRDARRRSDFGMPVSVGRTVELPRAPTDREWEMMVADLRETFRARGRESSRGEMREWTNSNLHAFVEPTATGYRLRLGTTMGNATPLNRVGAVSLVMAVVAFVLLFLSGRLGEDFMTALIFAGLGAGVLTFNALRLPAWADEREAQMEGFAARARALLGAPAEPAPGE